MPLSGPFGLGSFGSDPFGSNYNPFGVIGATALSPTLVTVSFSDPVDFAVPAILSPGNYTIPGLVVLAVAIEDVSSVRLTTSPMGFQVYTVTVAVAQSVLGTTLNPALNTAGFTGYPAQPAYFAVGMAPQRVRCVFSAPMLQNAALTTPSSYTVTDMQGVSLPVTQVLVEQALHPRSVILVLSTSMRTTSWYQTILAAVLRDEAGLQPLPVTSKFQFVSAPKQFTAELSRFSGEIESGLLGRPAGLVFFSPALQAALPNSVIQVTEVRACTTAYDEYHFPVLQDPAVFTTWAPPPVPETTFGQEGVALWASPHRLSEVLWDLGSTKNDSLSTPTETSCSVTLTEVYDPSYVALLSNPEWVLFDNTSATTPPIFICANNLAPIPSGSTSTAVLL